MMYLQNLCAMEANTIFPFFFIKMLCQILGKLQAKTIACLAMGHTKLYFILFMRFIHSSVWFRGKPNSNLIINLEIK